MIDLTNGFQQGVARGLEHKKRTDADRLAAQQIVNQQVDKLRTFCATEVMSLVSAIQDVVWSPNKSGMLSQIGIFPNDGAPHAKITLTYSERDIVPFVSVLDIEIRSFSGSLAFSAALSCKDPSTEECYKPWCEVGNGPALQKAIGEWISIAVPQAIDRLQKLVQHPDVLEQHAEKQLALSTTWIQESGYAKYEAINKGRSVFPGKVNVSLMN